MSVHFTSSHAYRGEIVSTCLIVRKKISLEKSLVPSRITYFLASKLTLLWLFILEKLICENNLLGEKGKYFLLRPCDTERWVFFPDSNNRAYNTDVVILALSCSLRDYNESSLELTMPMWNELYFQELWTLFNLNKFFLSRWAIVRCTVSGMNWPLWTSLTFLQISGPVE